MWEEAHESLWKILNDIGLEISDTLSNFDCYEFAIVKLTILMFLKQSEGLRYKVKSKPKISSTQSLLKQEQYEVLI
jgi:hypothetical protein